MAARAKRARGRDEDDLSAKDKIIMGPGAQVHGDARGGAAQHGLPRGRPRAHRQAAAQVDPVHKVTIIPRGRALGVTMQLPGDGPLQDNRDACSNRLRCCWRPHRRRGCS